MLKAAGVTVTGIDPTPAMLETARFGDPSATIARPRRTSSEFDRRVFDLVVSYLTRSTSSNFRTAIREMTRVLKPGGALLIANLTGFTSACAEQAG